MTPIQIAKLRALLAALRDQAAGDEQPADAREQGRRDAFSEAARELGRILNDGGGDE